MEKRRCTHLLISIALVGGLSLGCGGVKDLLPANTYDGDVECDASTPGRVPRGKDCVTTELVCGDVIKGTTENGGSIYDDHFYSGDSFCSSLPDNYSGPERIYRFSMPANAEAEVLMDSPCVDLDIFAIRWPDPHTCPNIHHSIGQCDEDDSKGDGRLELYSDSHERTFLLVVDGKDGVSGEFAIKINCWERG